MHEVLQSFHERHANDIEQSSNSSKHAVEVTFRHDKHSSAATENGSAESSAGGSSGGRHLLSPQGLFEDDDVRDCGSAAHDVIKEMIVKT